MIRQQRQVRIMSILRQYDVIKLQSLRECCLMFRR